MVHRLTMGTSQSNPGPNGNSPLVPPWADDEPEKPLPSPPLRRFQQFRRNLGDFVQSGNSSSLRSALGYYSRQTYGSGSVATRRLGSVTSAGAGLYQALSGGRVGGIQDDGPSFDWSAFTGKPTLEAINSLVDFLTPKNGDADKIRSSMHQALADALDGMPIFDLTRITGDVIINTLIGFLSESIFLQIVSDAGKSWTRAETALQQVRAENSLRELVKVVVDKKMALKLSNSSRPLSRNDVLTIQRQVIVEVWTEWGKYS